MNTLSVTAWSSLCEKYDTLVVMEQKLNKNTRNKNIGYTIKYSEDWLSVQTFYLILLIYLGIGFEGLEIVKDMYLCF